MSLNKRLIKQYTPIYNLSCCYALTFRFTVFFNMRSKKYVLEINLKL